MSLAEYDVPMDGRGGDIDRALLSAFQTVWSNAVDAATSADFRTGGQLDEATYLNYQSRVFEQAVGQARTAMAATFPLRVLRLSTRTVHALERDGIHSVADLVLRTEDDLLELRDFGTGMLAEVKAELDLIGVTLKPGGTGWWSSSR